MVFEDVYETYKRQTGGSGPPRNLTPLERSAQTAASESITNLERRLTWLATIASTSPFVGLFGTVIGIIDAFHGLGTAGAATLRAVAPGISEALITTAVSYTHLDVYKRQVSFGQKASPPSQSNR